MLTKQGSKKEALDVIVRDNVFRHAQSMDNFATHENVEFMVQNLMTKRVNDALR